MEFNRFRSHTENTIPIFLLLFFSQLQILEAFKTVSKAVKTKKIQFITIEYINIFSSMALKPNNIRWIRIGYEQYCKIMYRIV